MARQPEGIWDQDHQKESPSAPPKTSQGPLFYAGFFLFIILYKYWYIVLISLLIWSTYKITKYRTGKK